MHRNDQQRVVAASFMRRWWRALWGTYRWTWDAKNGWKYHGRTAGVASARQYLHPTRVDALLAVLEGECDGLSVTRETAEAILHYLDGNAAPAGVAGTLNDQQEKL